MTPDHKVDLAAVLRGAVEVPWRRRRVFVKALTFPGAAIVAYQAAYWRFSSLLETWEAWVAWGIHLLLWVIFAVTCHRLVLLDPQPGEVAVVPSWSMRETRFLAWMVAVYAGIWAAAWLVLAIVTMPLGTILMAMSMQNVLETAVPYAGLAVGTYFLGRWALAFPAAAIDAPTGPLVAWRLTRGNGGRMMVIVGALPVLVRYATSLLYSEEPKLGEVMLVTAVGMVLIAIEIAALSLAYRDLTSSGRSAA